MVTWSEENPDHGLRLGELKEDIGSVHSGADASRQGALKAAQKKKKVRSSNIYFLKNKKHSILLCNH